MASSGSEVDGDLKGKKEAKRDIRYLNCLRKIPDCKIMLSYFPNKTKILFSIFQGALIIGSVAACSPVL